MQTFFCRTKQDRWVELGGVVEGVTNAISLARFGGADDSRFSIKERRPNRRSADVDR